MTHAELDHQVRTVLPEILFRIGLNRFASKLGSLPPFGVNHRRIYRKELSETELFLENGTYGDSNHQPIDLVRDCLTELHVIR